MRTKFNLEEEIVKPLKEVVKGQCVESKKDIKRAIRLMKPLAVDGVIDLDNQTLWKIIDNKSYHRLNELLNKKELSVELRTTIAYCLEAFLGIPTQINFIEIFPDCAYDAIKAMADHSLAVNLIPKGFLFDSLFAHYENADIAIAKLREQPKYTNCSFFKNYFTSVEELLSVYSDRPETAMCFLGLGDHDFYLPEREITKLLLSHGPELLTRANINNAYHGMRRLKGGVRVDDIIKYMFAKHYDALCDITRIHKDRYALAIKVAGCILIDKDATLNSIHTFLSSVGCIGEVDVQATTGGLIASTPIMGHRGVLSTVLPLSLIKSAFTDHTVVSVEVFSKATAGKMIVDLSAWPENMISFFTHFEERWIPETRDDNYSVIFILPKDSDVQLNKSIVIKQGQLMVTPKSTQWRRSPGVYGATFMPTIIKTSDVESARLMADEPEIMTARFKVNDGMLQDATAMADEMLKMHGRLPVEDDPTVDSYNRDEKASLTRVVHDIPDPSSSALTEAEDSNDNEVVSYPMRVLCYEPDPSNGDK